MPRQHLGQRALAWAVGPHDGVYLARIDREADALEDLILTRAGAEVGNVKQVWYSSNKWRMA